VVKKGKKVASCLFFSILLDMDEQQYLPHGRATGTKRAEAFLCLPLFGRPEERVPLGGDSIVSVSGFLPYRPIFKCLT